MQNFTHYLYSIISACLAANILLPAINNLQCLNHWHPCTHVAGDLIVDHCPYFPLRWYDSKRNNYFHMYQGL